MRFRNRVKNLAACGCDIRQLFDHPNDDFDEYDAAKIEGWGSLNEDGTSFIAPDAIDEDINDPIKSLSDYEKPIEQPDIDD